MVYGNAFLFAPYTCILIGPVLRNMIGLMLIGPLNLILRRRIKTVAVALNAIPICNHGKFSPRKTAV